MCKTTTNATLYISFIKQETWTTIKLRSKVTQISRGASFSSFHPHLKTEMAHTCKDVVTIVTRGENKDMLPLCGLSGEQQLSNFCRWTLTSVPGFQMTATLTKWPGCHTQIKTRTNHMTRKETSTGKYKSMIRKKALEICLICFIISDTQR